MKPQSYLTKEGKKIFEEIVKHCEGIKMYDADSFQLSNLAQAFDLLERACKEMNKNRGGYTQQTQSGYSQVTAHFTVWKEAGNYINKNAIKFGLNPADREKIKQFSRLVDVEKPKSGSDKVQKYL